MIIVDSGVPSQDGVGLVDDEFDIVIASGSWDKRSQAILRSETIRTFSSVIVVFKDLGSSGRAKNHGRDVANFLAVRTHEPPIKVQVDSARPYQAWISIRDQTMSVYERLGRPLRVLVDLAAVPRFITLGLLGVGFRLGIISTYTALYVSASGYDAVLGPPIEPKFTAGAWSPTPIVGLGAGGRARMPSHLVVSLGFEGTKTRKLVDNLEPERVSVVLAAGVTDEFGQLAQTANDLLIRRYMIPANQVRVVSPIDVAACVSTFEELAAQSEIVGREEQVSFLLCGMKTHALAAAIASLRQRVSNVFYVVPDRREEVTASEFAAYHRISVEGTWAPIALVDRESR